MLNLRWSWHPATVELFESIDPAGWAASGGDPVAMLSSMRPGQLAGLAANEDFLSRLQAVLADLRGYVSEPRWYQSGAAGVSQALPNTIAYFSPEYGITAVLPQYSGGLGILAGDHLKSASLTVTCTGSPRPESASGARRRVSGSPCGSSAG